MKRTNKKKKGFTLIELLIVIVIMGLLMSLVAPTMFSKVGSSKQKTSMAQMQMLSTSLDTYRLDIGRYPENLQELRSSKEPGWDGPYLPREIPKDPWNNDYIYTIPGKDSAPYGLMSYGSDAQAGGSGEAEDVIFQ